MTARNQRSLYCPLEAHVVDSPFADADEHCTSDHSRSPLVIRQVNAPLAALLRLGVWARPHAQHHMVCPTQRRGVAVAASTAAVTSSSAAVNPRKRQHSPDPATSTTGTGTASKSVSKATGVHVPLVSLLTLSIEALLLMASTAATGESEELWSDRLQAHARARLTELKRLVSETDGGDNGVVEVDGDKILALMSALEERGHQD